MEIIMTYLRGLFFGLITPSWDVLRSTPIVSAKWMRNMITQASSMEHRTVHEFTHVITELII